MPQSACMSAFHWACVSDHGGDGGSDWGELERARARSRASHWLEFVTAESPSSDAEVARLAESAIAVCRSSGVSGRGSAAAVLTSGSHSPSS